MSTPGDLSGAPVSGGMVGGAFDTAAHYDNQLENWMPGLGSADLDILPAKPYIDARTRDSFRNDAYVQSGGEILKDTIVGSHFVLNCKPETTVLGLDDTWEEEFQEEVETKFTLWFESPMHWMDASRMGTGTDFVRLATGIIAMANEFLAAAEWTTDGRPFQTAVQAIDLDRLSNPMGMFNNPLLRGGVVRDIFGAPVAYKIRKAHPADFTMYANLDPFVWDTVPIRKPWGRQNVLHIVERNRPDQSRGMSQMASMLKETRIGKTLRDVALQNAVVQATYAASIESDLPSETVMAQMGGGAPGGFAAALEQYMTGFLGQVAKYAGNSRNLRINGAKIPHLLPGTKLHMNPASTNGSPMGGELESSILRYMAAGMGVSYESLSKDFSKVNYSSFKGAEAQALKSMRGKKKRGADRVATWIFRLWLEEAINAGEITSLSKKAPSIYDANGMLGTTFDAYTSCEWIGASLGQIDELKETQAAIQRVLFGLSTWEAELGRLGKDWRKVFKQMKREIDAMEKLGILQNMTMNMQNALLNSTSPNEPGEEKTKTGGGAAGAAVSAMMRQATTAQSEGDRA
jgi:lambda family phage portal protein